MLLVELGDGQTGSVDCYRITNVTVTQDGGRVGYGQSAPACVSLDGSDGTKMFDLDDIERG